MNKQPRIVCHFRKFNYVKESDNRKKGNSKEIDNAGNKNTLRK